MSHHTTHGDGLVKEKFLIQIDAQIECQGHSPDLNPLDIFLGGHIKALAFKQHPKSIEKLKLIVQELTNNQAIDLNERPVKTCQCSAGC